MRPLIVADIAELVFLLTLEAGAVTAFIGVAILGCAWLRVADGSDVR